MNQLETCVAKHSRNNLCRPLPLAHVTSWSNFIQIVLVGNLIAQPCKVFKDHILYLSYGAVAYRPSKKPYSWTDNAPVLMVFLPSALRTVKRFFPFDTGAIAAGRFRDSYLTNRGDFRTRCSIRFSPESTPSHWISLAFGTNSRYMERAPGLDPASSDDLLMLLARMQRYFKTEDRTDQRLVAVECHSSGNIPLEEVCWLGVPEGKREELADLFLRNQRILPPVFFYNRPAENGSLPVDLRTTAEEFFSAYECGSNPVRDVFKLTRFVKNLVSQGSTVA